MALIADLLHLGDRYQSYPTTVNAPYMYIPELHPHNKGQARLHQEHEELFLLRQWSQHVLKK